MKCHDLRGNEAAVAGLPSGFAPLYVPFDALPVEVFEQENGANDFAFSF